MPWAHTCVFDAMYYIYIYVYLYKFCYSKWYDYKTNVVICSNLFRIILASILCINNLQFSVLLWFSGLSSCSSHTAVFPASSTPPLCVLAFFAKPPILSIWPAHFNRLTTSLFCHYSNLHSNSSILFSYVLCNSSYPVIVTNPTPLLFLCQCHRLRPAIHVRLTHTGHLSFEFIWYVPVSHHDSRHQRFSKHFPCC